MLQYVQPGRFEDHTLFVSLIDVLITDQHTCDEKGKLMPQYCAVSFHYYQFVYLLTSSVLYHPILVYSSQQNRFVFYASVAWNTVIYSERTEHISKLTNYYILHSKQFTFLQYVQEPIPQDQSLPSLTLTLTQLNTVVIKPRINILFIKFSCLCGCKLCGRALANVT